MPVEGKRSDIVGEWEEGIKGLNIKGRIWSALSIAGMPVWVCLCAKSAGYERQLQSGVSVLPSCPGTLRLKLLHKTD